MKYSSNKFNYSNNKNIILSVSLNCYDTYYNDRANASFNYIKIKEIETPISV